MYKHERLHALLPDPAVNATLLTVTAVFMRLWPGPPAAGQVGNAGSAPRVGVSR